MAAPNKSPRLTETRNAKAHRDYFVDERFEAGIQLRGTEVKSIRSGQAQISDAFGRFEKGELWLHNAHIEPYAFASLDNHSVRRPRKLLLHRKEMNKLLGAIRRDGVTIVPLSIYFNERGRAKVELGLAKGKKMADKRQADKDRSWQRDKARIMRARG